MMDQETFNRLVLRAQLAPQEARALRFWLDGMTDNRELGRALGCAPSTAAVHRCRAKKKLQAAQDQWAREQAGRETEEEDAHDVSTRAGLARFVLQSMKLPRTAPAAPLLGLLWTELWYGTEVRQAMEGAVHAGPLVTVDDLLRVILARELGPNPYGRDTDDDGPYEPLAAAHREVLDRRRKK